MADEKKNLNLGMESETLRIATETIPSTVPGTSRILLPKTGLLRNINLYLNGQLSLDSSADGTLGYEGINTLIGDIRISGTPKSGGRNPGLLRKIDFAAAYQLNTILESFAGLKNNPTPITKSSSNSPFSASVDIDFAMPWSQEPRLTLLNLEEFDQMVMEVDWNPLTALFTAGVPSNGATAPNLVASIKRFVPRDPRMRTARFPFYTCNYQEKLVTAAQSDFSFDLNASSRLRGILLKTFTRNAVVGHTPVDTVINKITLMGDEKPIKDYPALGILKAENQKVYGVTAPTGYVFLDLMSEKKFDTLPKANKYGKLQLVLDVAGISNAVIRAYPIEIKA